MNAAGTTDSVGTVTAQSVTVSAADNGTCPFGGGFGGFGPRPGGAAPDGTDGTVLQAQ